MDASAKAVSAVSVDGTGKVFCHHDIAGISSGAHTVKATYIIKDAIFGDKESAQSVPFSFNVPVAPSVAPFTLQLSAD